MKRTITVVLVPMLWAGAWASGVLDWTKALPGSATVVELTELRGEDPQAPVRGDEVQAPRHHGGRPHDNEIQAPRMVQAA